MGIARAHRRWGCRVIGKCTRWPFGMARRSAPGPRLRSPPTRAGLLLNDPPAFGGDPHAVSIRRQLEPAPRDGKGEYIGIDRPLHDHHDRAPQDQRAAAAHRFAVAMELAHHCQRPFTPGCPPPQDRPAVSFRWTATVRGKETANNRQQSINPLGIYPAPGAEYRSRPAVRSPGPSPPAPPPLATAGRLGRAIGTAVPGRDR